MIRTLTFITPTFLSGAAQNMPEVRASSIRGELRWWFRVLGGTPQDETTIFGGVHGTVQSSKIIVRVSDVVPKQGETLHFAPMSDFGYLYYFAQASGAKEGIHRTQAGSYFAPGTTFKLTVLERRPLQDRSRYDQAVEAFIRLGTLGLRSTRGCGAMAEDKLLSRKEFTDWATTLSDDILVRLSENAVFKEWRKCQEAQGAFLRALRKDNHLSGKAESAFGFSDGKKRESSALRLRPVRVAEGYLPVVIYTDAACAQQSLFDTVKRETQPL